MKISHINIERFSLFRKNTINFSRGLNVFIGENGTGKTHLLKLLYSIVKTNEQERPASGPTGWDTELARNIIGVYKPVGDNPGRIVSRGIGRNHARIDLEFDSGNISFKITTPGNIQVIENNLKNNEKAIFIPSREALSIYEGFIPAYANRELSFDSTYYDLCISLSASKAKGRRLTIANELVAPLEQILGGKIYFDNERFNLSSPDGNLEAHLLAEGWRKIGSLIQLILNGSLIENGFLFWDEPEANLNPKLVTIIAKMLTSFAKSGVQVFISSHDYLLTNELSLLVGTESDLKDLINFFSFSRISGQENVSIESGALLSDLKNDPILEEFAAHYDRENKSVI